MGILSKERWRRFKTKALLQVHSLILKDHFSAKPKGKNPSDTRTDQLLKTTVAPISFSSMKYKSKPKLLVGAAFFSTGKKPTSMFKRSAQNTKPKQPSTYEKPTKEKEALPAPGERSPLRRCCLLKKTPESRNLQLRVPLMKMVRAANQHKRCWALNRCPLASWEICTVLPKS